MQLQDSEGDIAHARYSVFSVDSESQKYKLTVGGYSGSAGDDFGYHNGMKFSSIDEDNDLYGGFCGAGWWFHACSSTVLNGDYNVIKGIFWYRWRKYSLLKRTEMKIRTQERKCSLMKTLIDLCNYVVNPVVSVVGRRYNNESEHIKNSNC